MAVSTATKVCQLGRETTPGEAVAATTTWRGKASMENLQEVTPVEEDLGQYAPEPRFYVANAGAQIAMDNTPCTYEQICHILEAGIQTVTPAGTEAPYTYSYAFPAATTTQPTLKYYTIEYGDAEDNDEAEYCFVESFELSGTQDESVMMSAIWRGRQMTASGATGRQTLPAVEEVLFNKGVLSIDDTGGTVGDTAITNSFIEFSFSVTTGWQAVATAEGSLYFTYAKLFQPDITLSITAEHDSNWDSAGEKAKWDGSTIRLVRLYFTGTASRALTIDMAGVWTHFSSIEDRDGNSVLTGDLAVRYSLDDTLYCEIVVINTTATVP